VNYRRLLVLRQPNASALGYSPVKLTGIDSQGQDMLSIRELREFSPISNFLALFIFLVKIRAIRG
jgi:hypothetical protein